MTDPTGIGGEGTPAIRIVGELRVIDGPDEGHRFAIRDGSVLGRAESAEIVLADPGGLLSREHAKISVHGGVPVLEDLNSTNGTFLNGERVDGATPIRVGDQIRLGANTLEVVPRSSEGELRITGGPGAGNVVEVRGAATIGREPECDLQVLDSEVSRRHAVVIVRDGEAVIEDLHSSNGTYVNGERILGRRVLAPGDRIEIGEAVIEFTSPIFEGTAVRPVPPQVTSVRDILSQSSSLVRSAPGARKWWTLAVVCTTTFMLLLDVTIVAVAIPSISRALHPSFSSLQWIVDAYTLMLTAALLLAGSMADLFGRKRLLAIGIVIFVVASVVCAQAVNGTMLDFARGLQGVGGAVMFACSLALIVQEFPAPERGVAFGLYGAVTGLGIALGPLLGGILVEGISWQAIFYVNVPIGIAALIVLHRKLVNLPGPPTTIDWGGLVTFSSAAFLVTFATIRGNDEGWTSATTLGCYGVGVVLGLAFVAIELRREHPMLDLSLFRNSTFLGSSLSAITLSFALLALIIFLTTWMQSVLGYSALQAGLRMLAFTGAILLVGPLGGRLTTLVSPRITLTIGLALVAGGIASMTAISASSSWTVILPGLCAAGVGMGLMSPTLSATAVGVVPPWRGGMASGINSTCREAGTTVGIAIYGSLVQHAVRAHVRSVLAGTSLSGHARSVANAISVGGTGQLLAQSPPSSRPLLLHAARVSYAAGLHDAFLVGVGIAAAGALSAAILVRKHQIRFGAFAAH